MDCPFVVEEMGFGSAENEVCIGCNALKFLKLENLEEHRFRFFDYKEWFDINYLDPLENCPLKKDKINIEL